MPIGPRTARRFTVARQPRDKGVRFVLFVRHGYPAAIPTCALDFFLAGESLRSYCLRPIMVRGRGMGRKDEKTRIEALGWSGSRKMPHATKRRRKNRGMPPPATLGPCLGLRRRVLTAGRTKNITPSGGVASMA